ncbi:anti-anti-sigma factor family protein [Chlamydia ibidis]|uniref:Anti-sigma factor antagonist n=2 Tax=Chlamydia ibidis TaxID=1405396 RepID=S7J3K2_9CHLA|nr:STAS domain-containing protein [Chlamydia ibidis]EPP34607.1 anti-anti-sigma factor family protein [Chlamydia ibidis]EQM62302.1 anti-anti-sigma factor family protein [Chlamydia ibidis 10-1398/6]
MKSSSRLFNDILIVALEGALDAISVPKIQDFLESRVIEGVRKLVLNFQGVTYMSSAGIRLLFSVSKLMQKQSGLLCICCVQPSVNEVVHMAGIDQLLPVCSSEQECFAKF